MRGECAWVVAAPPWACQSDAVNDEVHVGVWWSLEDDPHAVLVIGDRADSLAWLLVAFLFCDERRGQHDADEYHVDLWWLLLVQPRARMLVSSPCS